MVIPDLPGSGARRRWKPNASLVPNSPGQRSSKGGPPVAHFLNIPCTPCSETARAVMNTLNSAGRDAARSCPLGQHDSPIVCIGTFLAYATGGKRITAPGFHHSNM